MTVPPLRSLTAQALDAKFANKQRRYESKYSASYLHNPPPPPRLAAPPRPPNPMFEALRAAAAHLDLPEQDEQHGLPAEASAVTMRRRPVRKAMLGGTAALALCALAAGSYYAWAARASDGGQAAVNATINATLATLAQRFHDLAANQSLFRTLSEKVALLRPVFAPAPEAGPAAPPARDVAAAAPALRPASPAPAAEPAALVAAMPGQPTPDALTPAPSASSSFSPAPSAATSPAGVQAPGSPRPAEAAAPDTAASIVTPQQPVGLLALVRQVGLLVRDAQAENEKLRTDVVGLIGSLQAKLTDLNQRLDATTHDMRGVRDEAAQLRTEVAVLADTLQVSSRTLERRLDLALARDPAAAASEPGKQQDGAAAPAATAPDDGKAAAAEAATAGSERIVPGYHVQAASFGVAVLSSASAAPGQAGGRLVTVGDQVPGVGRVTSIIPHGTSWIVQTDHGTIQ